jgi:hypothetical protein
MILAPRFPAIRDMSARVAINSGAVASDGRFFPRDAWRLLTEAEGGLLLAGHSATVFPGDDVSLFAMTERLRARWWDLAAAGMGRPGSGDEWFTSYAREVTEFARFKGLPLSSKCSIEAIVSPAGQPSTRTVLGPEGVQLAGLSFSKAASFAPTVGATGDSHDRMRVLGGINLGDEPTSIVFVNLSPRRMAERLLADGLDRGFDEAEAEVARSFLGRFSDYPLVRLTINPAEGFWLPNDGIVFDGYTLDQTGMAVLLVFQARD